MMAKPMLPAFWMTRDITVFPLHALGRATLFVRLRLIGVV